MRLQWTTLHHTTLSRESTADRCRSSTSMQMHSAHVFLGRLQPAARGCEVSDLLNAACDALHMAKPAKLTSADDGCHIQRPSLRSSWSEETSSCSYKPQIQWIIERTLGCRHRRSEVLGPHISCSSRVHQKQTEFINSHFYKPANLHNFICMWHLILN